MNSWQQPVTAEFGRGTMKKHMAALVDTDPDTSVTEVDCSGEAPLGFRTVLLHVDIGSTGAVYTVSFWDDPGAGAGALWAHLVTVGANADAHEQFICGVDAAGKLYYQASHANINSLDIDMIGYWI